MALVAYDVIIIVGGGYNGLIAVNYVGLAGNREGRMISSVGGSTRSSTCGTNWRGLAL